MKTTKHIAALLAALVLALSLTACGQTAAKDDPMNPAIPVADGAEIGEGDARPSPRRSPIRTARPSPSPFTRTRRPWATRC